MQEGNTANLIFGVADTVAWLSRTITLDARRHHRHRHAGRRRRPPGLFLRAGDTVEVEVDGLGALTNHVRAE